MLLFLTSLFTEWRQQAQFRHSAGTGLCPLAYAMSNTSLF